MQSDYNSELHELHAIYGATIEKMDAVYAKKLERIVQFMADFVDCHQARKRYKRKIDILESKLTEESSDEENYDEDQCCC